MGEDAVFFPQFLRTRLLTARADGSALSMFLCSWHQYMASPHRSLITLIAVGVFSLFGHRGGHDMDH